MNHHDFIDIVLKRKDVKCKDKFWSKNIMDQESVMYGDPKLKFEWNCDISLKNYALLYSIGKSVKVPSFATREHRSMRMTQWLILWPAECSPHSSFILKHLADLSCISPKSFNEF